MFENPIYAECNKNSFNSNCRGRGSSTGEENMATISEIRARLANLNRRGNTKNPDVWKPSDEHDVRLLRNPHNSDPLEEVTFHFNVGDARELLCPAQFGDECVICDFANQLKGFKDEKGNDKKKADKDADWEIFKKIQAQTKVFVPMIERTKDEKGNIVGHSEPAWWGLTGNQSQQALSVCGEADRLRACSIDPDDDEKALDALFGSKKAFDLHVKYAKPGEKGNTKTFTAITINPVYLPSPLTGTPAKDTELLKKIKPIREVFPKLPASEVESALKKFIGGGMKVEERDPKKTEEKYAGKGKDKAEKAGERSVEESFEDLLNAAK